MRQRALISVSDKRGLEGFARGLIDIGFELISTGGTARALRAAALSVTEISVVTGTPEVMDGRVKTLHPSVFAAILADLDRPDHVAVLRDWDLVPITLVAVNLYPFEAVADDPEATTNDLIENIDIGGPSLVRAAAKNHRHVTVLVDPEDYTGVLAEARSGGISNDMRRRLAVKAFRHTAHYDAIIAARLPSFLDLPPDLGVGALAPWVGTTGVALRYGENPHQEALLLRAHPAEGLASFNQLQGKELSYNNLMDADGAWRLVFDLPAPGTAIIKHAAPCGAAIGTVAAQVYADALATDAVSAFGGVIASSLPIDGETATRIVDLFAEVVVAPRITSEAREVFASKKNLRVLEASPPAPGRPRLRVIDGGLLVQTADEGWQEGWKVVTQRRPTEEEQQALVLAWRVVKHALSNAIVIAHPTATIGIGAGQPSRVDSCRIAVDKACRAELPIPGAAAGSDAFFPFPDGLEVLAEAGVTAVVQPGGSVRDRSVIETADRLGVAMVFTGRRHFRH